MYQLTQDRIWYERRGAEEGNGGYCEQLYLARPAGNRCGRLCTDRQPACSGNTSPRRPLPAGATSRVGAISLARGFSLCVVTVR